MNADLTQAELTNDQDHQILSNWTCCIHSSFYYGQINLWDMGLIGKAVFDAPNFAHTRSSIEAQTYHLAKAQRLLETMENNQH